MKKAALHNLGCKVNAYETEAMRELLQKNGYEIVPFSETADVYVINTCTVTNIADRKSRQMLHRAQKKNPDAVIVAAGCYVQVKGEEADPCIDIVIGNNKKNELASVLDQYFESHRKQASLIEIGKTNEYEDMSIEIQDGHTRANVKVQDGCNQFCSYCIIPYARGRVRSRSIEDVVREVTLLADNGYREIVLTGIHLSSYGIDHGEDLLSLLRAVHRVEKIKRIRLGSLEPRIITETFVKEISGMSKFCPHFHLSLQSGCDETLRRMNRRYTTAEYEAACNLLREAFDNPAITTDVIVGFPGETEKEYLTSKAFVDKIGFYETHIFKYSVREGTRAATMKDQVPESIKASRSEDMIDLGSRKKKEYENRFLGKETEVLFEEEIRDGDKTIQVGRTREYVKLGIVSSENLTNQIMKLRIENPVQILD